MKYVCLSCETQYTIGHYISTCSNCKSKRVMGINQQNYIIRYEDGITMNGQGIKYIIDCNNKEIITLQDFIETLQILLQENDIPWNIIDQISYCIEGDLSGYHINIDYYCNDELDKYIDTINDILFYGLQVKFKKGV